MPDRPVPLLGEIALEYVQRVEHALDAGFTSTPIAGLAGELQQRVSRGGHRIGISGLLFGDNAKDQLATLQNAAAAGDELTFSADISSALDLQKVVITQLHALELAGQPGRYQYELQLVESPALPPPAQVSGFGGLDDFGLGDLGFDTDVLGEISELAGEVAGAVDSALQVIDAVQALSNLDGLDLGNFLSPLADAGERVKQIGTSFQDAIHALTEGLT